MFSGDCNSQTTNIYNLAKPYTVAYTTISSSVSRYKHQLSNRTQNHYSTEVLTTVNTGMYWYTLIICNTWLYIWVTLRVSYEMPFASTWVHPRFFGGVRVDPLFSFLCCPIVCFYVTISHKNYVRFVYFQLFLVVRMSYLCYLCVFAHSGVHHILYLFFSSCSQSLSPATDRIRLDAISKWTPDHPLKTPLAKSSSISIFF